MNSTGKSPKCRYWHIYAFLTLLALGLGATLHESIHRAYIKEELLAPADFPVFYVAGKMALQQPGQRLYYMHADRKRDWWFFPVDSSTPWTDLAHSSGLPGTTLFITPPFSALMMMPFAKLPWRAAYLAWQLSVIILTAAAIYLILRVAWEGDFFAAFSVFLIAACCFDPLRRNLMLGQINGPILFFWAAGVYLLYRRRPVSSAFCFALGTVIKLAPALVVPLLILRRQWRWLAGYVVSVVVLTGLSVWRLGWQNHVTWLKEIYPAISGEAGVLDNRSLPGLISIYGPACLPAISSQGWGLFLKALGLALILGFFYWCWKKRQDARGLVYEMTLLPLIYLLASPVSWRTHFLLLFLPLTYLWAKSRKAATHLELAVLTLSTLFFGTIIPDYAAESLPWARSLLTVIVAGLWPAATLALVWAGMRMYSRTCCPEE